MWPGTLSYNSYDFQEHQQLGNEDLYIYAGNFFLTFPILKF